MLLGHLGQRMWQKPMSQTSVTDVCGFRCHHMVIKPFLPCPAGMAQYDEDAVADLISRIQASCGGASSLVKCTVDGCESTEEGSTGMVETSSADEINHRSTIS